MADLVHITTARSADRIARSGIAARSRGRDGRRGVYVMPVLPSFTLTHQWVREIRRWKPGVLVAVHVRIPDGEPVTVGRYSDIPQPVPADRAAALVGRLADPRGYEVFVPRALTASEIRRIRSVPQGIGWRYLPNAHGRRPCGCPACTSPGTPGSGRIRRRHAASEDRDPTPVLMARLIAATTVDDIEEALWAMGGRSRGNTGELAYLLNHPSLVVRQALYDLLTRYRGPEAKRMRAALATDPLIERD